MLDMLFEVLRVNQDIIHVGRRKIVKIFAKYGVNIPLKGSRPISHSKRHYLVLKRPIPCPKGSKIF
jgi:hypothetical protein